MKIALDDADRLPVLSPWKIALMKGLWLVIGLAMSCLMYFECLHSADCNNVATAFFAIIGLACFFNVGLPVDKVLSSMTL